MSVGYECTKQEAGQAPRPPTYVSGYWRLVAVVDAGVKEFWNSSASETYRAPAVYLYWEHSENGK